jgi:transposase
MFFTKLRPCRVGIEACGTSHRWARELAKTRARGSADAACVRKAVCEALHDGRERPEAICEAVTRPTMRFVPVKSPEQQARTALLRNALRNALEEGERRQQFHPARTEVRAL